MSALQQFLNSPENLRALEALKIIKDPRRNPIELTGLAPLPNQYAEKVPRSRTKYIPKNLVAECYKFDELTATQTGPNTAEVGPRKTGSEETPEIRHKLLCYITLRAMNLEGDSNDWRGSLDSHIIDQAIYNPEEWRLEFAQATAKANPSILVYLHATYKWTSDPAKYERAKKIGLDPSKSREPIKTCMTYMKCSAGGNDTEEGRNLVIEEVLKDGLAPDPLDVAVLVLSQPPGDLVSILEHSHFELITKACPSPWQEAIPGIPATEINQAVTAMQEAALTWRNNPTEENRDLTFLASNRLRPIYQAARQAVSARRAQEEAT